MDNETSFQGLSRRNFLKLGFATAFLSLIGGYRGFKPVDGLPTTSNNSIIVASNGLPEELVNGAFESLGGVDHFVSSGDKVLIKPNASFAYGSERATNTSPQIARAVGNLCFHAGASEVIFADNVLMKPGSVTVKTNGLKQAAEGCGGEFVVLEKKSDFELVRIEGSTVLEQVEVAKLYNDCDVFINLPVMKHHSGTYSTVAMKNLMGLVYDRSAFHRKGLNECIAELSLAIRPDVVIVDVTRALLSNGPKGPGDVKEIGKVVAGVDPVAVDVSCLALGLAMGYKDFSLDGVRNRYIDLAAGLGVGDGDPSSVAAKTFDLDVANSQSQSVIVPTDDDFERGKAKLPAWMPYASLSAVSIAIGFAAILYSRRRVRVARKER